jgi:anti-sigma B factor antagonist
MTDEPRRIERGLLTIRSEPQVAHLISLHGEMDGATAKALDDEFITIEATSASRIVLDLSELEFIDSTGLAVIMRAHGRAKNDGHVLRVLRPNGQDGQVSRMFEFCGLDGVLAFGN